LELRQRVKEIIGEGPCVSGAELPFTPRTKRMLDLALNEAQRLKHDEIGTGHILLGLLREGHGVAARVLTEKGLNLGKLIEVTEAKLLENIAKKSSSYSSGGTSAINEEDYEK
jgi:ATP-dependent Clp protease ATP-binding subunit ClpC